MKKVVVNGLKLAVSLGILAALLLLPSNQQAFQNVWNQPKDWGMLALGAVFCVVGVVVTIIRWHWLVTTLGMPFRMRDAFRLGFFGFLCNYISLGSVGGDLFKAVFLAREQKGRRTEAVASVLFDRVLGLVGLLFIVAAAAWWSDLMFLGDRKLRIICWFAWIGSGLAVVGGGLSLLPGFTTGPIFEALTKLKRLGPVFSKLFEAVRMYRQRMGVVFGALGLSVAAHGLFVMCIWCVALGLPGPRAEFKSQCVIVPLGILAGAAPLPGGGLGTYEAAMEFLFRTIPNNPPFEPGQGTSVAFGYRAVTILVALIGFVYWLTSRRELKRLMEQAEASETPNDGSPADHPAAKTSPALTDRRPARFNAVRSPQP